MRKILLGSAAALIIAPLISGCSDWYAASGRPLPYQPPVAAAPGIPLDNDAGQPATVPVILGAPFNPTNYGDVNDNSSPAPVHPRRHYRQPPVTAQPDDQPDDEPPVAQLPPQPASPPEPPPVIARPTPPRSPPPPSTGFFSGPAGCAGRWWDLCHAL